MNSGMILHTDKYQVNMMYAHWFHNTADRKAVFDLYFRKLPFGNGYAVFAGLERAVDYLLNLRFTDDDLQYLAKQEENYDPAFLEQLKHFKFSGSVLAIPEGSLVFPNEPLLRIEARLFEAHLIETALLNFINFQTLIATKAARIKHAAGDDILMEFGARRAHEADAALWGARSAYISGFHATSHMLAGRRFGIPTAGTHAHSWIQSQGDEEEAFRKYAAALPDQTTLLVDTYHTLRTGIPNAIRIGKEMEEQGKRLKAIRLDSGDLAYLSIQARKMLDDAGLHDVKIVASSDVDEDTIFNLKGQGARIDSWGVGTRLITAGNEPALGGVYKMAARMNGQGEYVPTVKLSSNPDKMTTPGLKRVFRLFNPQTGKAIADCMIMEGEEKDALNGEKLHVIDPQHPFRKRQLEQYEAVPLLHEVIREGKLVRPLPSLQEIRSNFEEQKMTFWPEYLRLLNPERYPVYFSERLWHLRIQELNHV